MSQPKLATSIPPVKLILIDREDDMRNPEAMRNLGALESPIRGLSRPTRIATPVDIRWPMVHDFLRGGNLLPNRRKLYEREQCLWADLKLRHLGQYKEYLMAHFVMQV
jgi:hypothetical protein